MTNREKNDRDLSSEKARTILFLKGWRHLLLLHQERGDADGMELDRRILDYYLDLYRETEAFHSPDIAARSLTIVAEIGDPGRTAGVQSARHSEEAELESPPIAA